jgi:hypothetical protein
LLHYSRSVNSWRAVPLGTDVGLVLIYIWLSCQLMWIQCEINKKCYHVIGLKVGWKKY